MNVSNITGSLPRRASLAVAFAAGVLLLAAPLGAAVAVNPWQGTPSAPAVAPIDAPGLNVVDRAEVVAAPALSKGEAVEREALEREVGAWTATSTKGPGPRPSPKK